MLFFGALTNCSWAMGSGTLQHTTRMQKGSGWRAHVQGTGACPLGKGAVARRYMIRVLGWGGGGGQLVSMALRAGPGC